MCRPSVFETKRTIVAPQGWGMSGVSGAMRTTSVSTPASHLRSTRHWFLSRPLKWYTPVDEFSVESVERFLDDGAVGDLIMPFAFRDLPTVFDEMVSEFREPFDGPLPNADGCGFLGH